MIKSLTFLMLLTLQASSTLAEGIRVAYVEFPPFTYTDTNGRAAGLFIDVGRRVLKRNNITIGSEKSYPAPRMLRYLEMGKADIWYGIRIPDVESYTYYGKEPVGRIEMNLYTIGATPEINRKEDLKGKTVLLILGYSYSDWGPFIRDPSSGVKFHQTSSHEIALKMLKSGRVEYLLDYAYPVKTALQTIDVPGLEKKKLSVLDCFFSVSKKYPGAKDLVEHLDTALRDIKTTMD